MGSKVAEPPAKYGHLTIQPAHSTAACAALLDASKGSHAGSLPHVRWYPDVCSACCARVLRVLRVLCAQALAGHAAELVESNISSEGNIPSELSAAGGQLTRVLYD
jgi:hypothetical protein